MATYSKQGKSVLLVATLPSDDGPATDIQEYGMDDGLPMQFGSVIPGATDTNDLYFIGMVQIFAANNPGEPLELRETSVKAVYEALQGE